MQYPASFLSTLLAQRKLRFSGNNSGGSAPLYSIIATQYCNNTMTNNSNISEIPTFRQVKEEEQYTDYGLPLSEVVATFARRTKSVYESLLVSSRGQITLEKADEYEIPYDPHSINFLELFDKVEEFELTIAKANEYGIDWRNFGYDLIGIEQEISEAIAEEHSYRKYAHLEFLATRGV
ncbi:hypothetical protein Megvenef_01439 [Candidatus Megaera venefica]|uniref:Uncharacterized protein n=1 Tax=Candidatus Megaera venefica TaxID=2055910 RepID=A0ABU5NE62_9RICK|nr:hypothetical protein [Candidatus Megaera venefica]MEA0971460.1 hypothetical protein [Candidatus Megaera venefica]